MAKSTVPVFPLRDSSFHKTRARQAAALKLRRLGPYLALERARCLLRMETAFDWLPVLLLVLAGVAHIAKTFGLPGAALLEQAVYYSAALLLIAVLFGSGAQKLGLIDLACFRKKSLAPKVEAEAAVYVPPKPEVPIAESLARATADTFESDIKDALNEAAKTLEWQTVEIKNAGKIRYTFSSSRPGGDSAGQ